MVGDSVVVDPSHMVVAPVMVAVGGLSTVILEVGLEEQPVEVLVKVKLADPVLTSVTFLRLSQKQLVGLLLIHVPPEVGES